jgi:phosphatidylglycerophosphatase A
MLRRRGLLVQGALAALVTAVGVWAASVVARKTKTKDPQIVVIDEVAGTLWTLMAAKGGVGSLATGVVLFRVFDSTKPWPAGWIERHLPDGWGIVLDDVAAAAWAAGGLMLLRKMGRRYMQ